MEDDRRIAQPDTPAGPLSPDGADYDQADRTRLREANIIDDVNATVAAKAIARHGRVGIVGFCLGGRVAI